MAKTQPPPLPVSNQLLARLSRAAYQRLAPHLQPVALPQKLVLYETGDRIDHAYFPVRCVLSALTLMANGDAIEVTMVGPEGGVGLLPVLGVAASANRVIVQIPGEALRLPSAVLNREAGRKGSLRRLLHLYHAAMLAQVSRAAACNGLHTVQQRCCRWLLKTRDRVPTDELGLTQEFLAVMLGVRRASVTDVLRPLKERGLVRSVRGRITVLDRAGLEATACECYRCVVEEFERLFRGF